MPANLICPIFPYWDSSRANFLSKAGQSSNIFKGFLSKAGQNSNSQTGNCTPLQEHVHCPTKIKRHDSELLNFSAKRIFCFLICRPIYILFSSLFNSFEFLRCEQPTPEFSTFYLLSFVCNMSLWRLAFGASRGSVPMARIYDSQLCNSLRSLLARRALGTPKDNGVDASIDIFLVASLEYHLI